MDLVTFKKSLSKESPPAGLSPELCALWADGRGDWEQAHNIVQDERGKAAAWVHAYLHRKEGDTSNARYWYAQARKPQSKKSLDSEWEEIVAELLVG